MHLMHNKQTFSDGLFFSSARIDDYEPCFKSDHWTKKSKQSGQQAPLRADRWNSTVANAASDSDSDHNCSSILGIAQRSEG